MLGLNIQLENNYMFYSDSSFELLEKNIVLSKTIKKMLNPKTSNKKRSYSLAQKIRKKTLPKILNKNYDIDLEILNIFNDLIGERIDNVIDYLNFNFSKYLSVNKISKKIVFTNNQKNKTKITDSLIELFEKNIFEYIDMIVHGSQSNGEVTKYSDADVTIFIKNKLIATHDDLKKVFFQIETINKKISFFDPISHHSVFLNLDADLFCYPESFMPIKVLELGNLPKNKEVKFYGTRDDLDLKVENFLNILNIILAQFNSGAINNLFGLKQLISSYFMLIILEYEIINEDYSDKKEIFQKKIINYKTKKELETFSQASSIRNKWPEISMLNVGLSSNFTKNIIKDSLIMLENIQNDKIIKKISEKYLS